jgi:cobalt-zinc-cadmium efflux system outer membrane protein
MIKRLTVALLLSGTLWAQNVDAIVTKALHNSPSLKSIREKISANRRDVDLASQFANPQLQLSVNDIQFDDPFDRSLEPMQFEAVNLKQSIPYFGKRDAHAEIAKANEKVLFHSLEDAKAQLVAQVKKSVYTIWQLETLYAITCDYEALTRQNIELNTAYTATMKGRHMGIMSAELALSQLKIKKSSLSKALEGEYAMLSYLASEPITSVDVNLKIGVLPLLESYEQRLPDNKALQAKDAAVMREHAAVRSAELESYVDPYIQVGYYHREAFPDYLSFAVGSSLPLYGSESLKEERARKMALVRSHEFADYKAKLAARLEQNYAALRDAYTTYHIIKDESLPQIEHMFDLANAAVRSGGDLFKYIDLLKQKLGLDTQKVVATARFFRYEAEIDALLGAQR